MVCWSTNIRFVIILDDKPIPNFAIDQPFMSLCVYHKEDGELSYNGLIFEGIGIQSEYLRVLAFSITTTNF